MTKIYHVGVHKFGVYSIWVEVSDSGSLVKLKTLIKAAKYKHRQLPRKVESSAFQKAQTP